MQFTLIKENSSDDFFQMKHLRKREDEKNSKYAEIFDKLKEGLEKVKVSYISNDWGSTEERLFLELFSKFHVANWCFYYRNAGGYLLLDDDDNATCVYTLQNNCLLAEYESINGTFIAKSKISCASKEKFFAEMLEKYFDIYDVLVFF